MGIEPTWERLHAPTPDLKSGSPTSELGASKMQKYILLLRAWQSPFAGRTSPTSAVIQIDQVAQTRNQAKTQIAPAPGRRSPESINGAKPNLHQLVFSGSDPDFRGVD